MRDTDGGKYLIVAVLTASLAWMPAGAGAQALTEQQGDAILEELKQIRQLLEKQGGTARAQRPQRPTSAKVSIKERPAIGDPGAPVTLVEFADYECPFCNRFFQNIWPLITKDYIDTGKLRVVVKDLPLGFHPNARKAAQASHCAAEQGRFQEMRNTLYRNARKLSAELLPGYGKVIGLDVADFEACLGSERHLDRIDADAAEARRAGLTGTPSFIVGKTSGDAVEGTVIVGAQPYSVFTSRIEAALEAATKQ